MIYVSKTAKRDIVIKRGDTFFLNFRLKLNEVYVNLSAYTEAKLQIKASETAAPILTYTSNDAINISNLAAGQIIIFGQTTNLLAGTYYYDLQLKNNTTTETILSGEIYIEYDYTE